MLVRPVVFTLPFFFHPLGPPLDLHFSLHDALPISSRRRRWGKTAPSASRRSSPRRQSRTGDRRRSRSEEHTSELQSPDHLVCRLLLEKKNRECRPFADSSTSASRAFPAASRTKSPA